MSANRPRADRSIPLAGVTAPRRVRPRRRASMLGLALAMTIALGLVGSPGAAIAATGGVYFDTSNNVAAGDFSQFFNGSLSGFDNVGIGRSVMPNLESGVENTAAGNFALDSVTTGSVNLAAGGGALYSNTGGSSNVAAGASALALNTTGSNNVAGGFKALYTNDTGDDNVAVGTSAVTVNSTGHDNVGLGFNALVSNTTGSSNLAIGSGAGQNLTTGSGNIDIANAGKASESKAIRIGAKGAQTRTWIAGISGKTVSGTAQPVLVNSQGQLGTGSVTAKAAGSDAAAELERQKTRNRRQGAEIGRQADRITEQAHDIARLERRVAKLSHAH